MKDPEYSRPVGDDRLWLKNRLGSDYSGEPPEKHSPADRDQELKNLREVLFGVRFPRTSYEAQWLRYMGGSQTEPPAKAVICRRCKCSFQARGFPAPSGGANYPTACQRCADEEDARIGYGSKTSKKVVRSAYTE
jgi:hypothetical protein